MEFSDYQAEAKKTDKNPTVDDKGLFIPLLGLASETGELLSAYKKYFRDGQSHRLFKERLAEELGDLLWYLSNCATKADISMEAIARQNLLKCKARWRQSDADTIGLLFVSDFDSQCPESERLPRRMTVELSEVAHNGGKALVTYVDGRQRGNPLTDNSYSSDGYRFHDVFHFAYASVLGWSPVVRSIMQRKRKSISKMDEVEDGGRAIAIEEGISAMVFSYAGQHKYLEGISALDYELIRLIRVMTAGLEVAKCNDGDWENAIFQGYTVWRRINLQSGGKFTVDLDNRIIKCID